MKIKKTGGGLEHEQRERPVQLATVCFGDPWDGWWPAWADRVEAVLGQRPLKLGIEHVPGRTREALKGFADQSQVPLKDAAVAGAVAAVGGPVVMLDMDWLPRSRIDFDRLLGREWMGVPETDETGRGFAWQGRQRRELNASVVGLRIDLASRFEELVSSAAFREQFWRTLMPGQLVLTLLAWELWEDERLALWPAELSPSYLRGGRDLAVHYHGAGGKEALGRVLGSEQSEVRSQK